MAPVNRFAARAAFRSRIGIDEAGINDDRDMLQEMRLVLRAHREPGIDAPPSDTGAGAAHGDRARRRHDAVSQGASAGCRTRDGGGPRAVRLEFRDLGPIRTMRLGFVDVLVQRAKARNRSRASWWRANWIYRARRFTPRRPRRAGARLCLARDRSRRSEARRRRSDRIALAEAVMPHVQPLLRGLARRARRRAASTARAGGG